MLLTFWEILFSDLRKPGLVPGESLSLSIKIDSVKEKYSAYKEFIVLAFMVKIK